MTRLLSQSDSNTTEAYCRYVDYLTTIDISYIATWEQRHRYESTITLACSEKDRQAGPMNTRKDFKPTTQVLASLPQEQGRQNSFYPKNERTRQRPFDEELQAKLEWLSHNWRTNFAQSFFCSSFSQNAKKPNGEITNGEIRNGESVFFFSEKFHVQTLANVVHATVSEDTTPRRTHIFLSFGVSRMLEHI